VTTYTLYVTLEKYFEGMYNNIFAGYFTMVSYLGYRKNRKMMFRITVRNLNLQILIGE
jgi:hypothetical protein